MYMIDQRLLQDVRLGLESKLHELEKEHNLKFNIGTMRYGEFDFSVKLTAELVEDGLEEKMFSRVCEFYNLEPKHYGFQFSNQGKLYKLIGFEQNRPTYCIKAVNINTGEETLFHKNLIKIIKRDFDNHIAK